MSPVEETFQLGISLHRRGELTKAQQVYGRLLQDHPAHFGALHLSGVIASQTGNPRLAARLIHQAIAINRGHAGAWCDLGSALKQLNEPEAALTSYEQAIAIDGRLADAYSNRGVLLTELGRFAAALESLERAIELRPTFAAAHFNRGNVHKLEGKLDAALASFDRAIEIDPRYAAAHFNRGCLLQDAAKWDAALASFEGVLAVDPGHVKALINRGIVLKELGQLEAALASFERALSLDGHCAEALCNRGVVLGQLKRPDLALTSLDRAIAIRPAYAEALCNRGNVLRELDRLDEALACYRQSIALDGSFAEAHCNLGVTMTDLRQFREAFASYELAIALRPDYADAHLNKAMALLMLGHFEEGWSDYEWRRKRSGRGASLGAHLRGAPLWLGAESVAGKTVLLWSEQGLGDTLQFCRYVRCVVNLGATVIMDVQPQLLEVLGGLSGMPALIGTGGEAPAFDYHCPLPSLPLAFKTTLASMPFPGKYLDTDPALVELWRDRLGERTRPRIGLVWSGSKDNRNDRNRSMPLALLLQSLPPEFQYFSLQKDVRDSDRLALEKRPDIQDLGLDFANTAAVCDCLDLVISVDTSIAHLSAAIGRETWILLSFNADWRWLLERKDSPWYDSVCLYRQETRGGWQGALERLRADLRGRFPATRGEERRFDRPACREEMQ